LEWSEAGIGILVVASLAGVLLEPLSLHTSSSRPLDPRFTDKDIYDAVLCCEHELREGFIKFSTVGVVLAGQRQP
jgi:hypothetical protein